MKRRLMLAALAATGGVLTAACLQAAIAVADVPSAAGEDAFTIGNYIFDPFSYVNPDDPTGGMTEGFTLVPQFTGAPPLLELGGVSALGLNLSEQDFQVFNPAGDEIGTINSAVTVTNLLGLSNTAFTVTEADGTISSLPPVGSVYDVFNLGNGYSNVYTAIPGGLDGNSTVTDTLITPNGSIDLTPLFGSIDASVPLQPGEAFLGLQTPADAAIGHDAFTLAGIHWDPITNAGPEGFDPVGVTATAPPLLIIGGASLGDPAEGGSLVTQQFYIDSLTNGTPTQIGYAQAGEEVTKLLGFTNTQLVVGSVSNYTADGATTGLPTEGAVYDALYLGNGYTNVYTAIPGLDGAADKITDTLITPNGSIDLSALFGDIDAAAALHPEDAFTGLLAGNSAIGTEAFTIGGTTFDPTLAAGGEGFDPVFQTVGAPPLLLLGGGNVVFPGSSPFDGLQLAQQSFDVYDGNMPSDQLGSISTFENVTVLLGLTNTEFVVTGVDATGDGTLPTLGSVYDVFNLGNGYENIYTAIAGVDGGPSTITDTFVTPMGSYDLTSLFGGIDAVQLLNPGDAFAGLDAASGATAGAADLFSIFGL